MSDYIAALEYFAIPDFTLASGIRKSVRVAYRSFNPNSTKGTVLVLTCFQGRINKTLNFTPGALKEYNVVVVAMLGNGESSSPSNDADFPSDYSLRYQASNICVCPPSLSDYYPNSGSFAVNLLSSIRDDRIASIRNTCC